MKIVSLAEAKAKLSKYVNDSQNELIVITKNGKPAAVIQSVTNEDDLESMALAANPRFRNLLNQASSRLEKEGGFSEDEMAYALDLDPKEVFGK